MEYSINKLAKMASVSTRTLRYYHQIGLLEPLRVSASGYRIYGGAQVDRLQQIMLYRELGVALEDIRALMSAPDLDTDTLLRQHLASLNSRREQLDLLIRSVENTILARKGETIMTDNEKFEGFKQKLIDENEAQYGHEIREKYGDTAIDKSNARLKSMSQQQHRHLEDLRLEINTLLAQAVSGKPSDPVAQQLCALHKEWLCGYYPDYTAEYHKCMGQMYVDDPRFAGYYNDAAPGGAAFLRDAIFEFCR